MSISFICCYNNEKQLNSMFLPSIEKLKNRVVDFNPHVLLIDNGNSKYHSAASAFNTEIISHLNELGDILCCVHQDIAFDDGAFIKELVESFEHNPNLIIGFSGKKNNDESYSNLRYYATKNYIVNNQISEMTDVECVDECCFAIPKALFLKMMFDEDVCYHWHLYAVELCYHARRDLGTQVRVASTSIYHKMNDDIGLTIDKYFFETLKRIIKKYKKDYKKIYAPCYTIFTNSILARMQLLKTKIDTTLHHNKRFA